MLKNLRTTHVQMYSSESVVTERKMKLKTFFNFFLVFQFTTTRSYQQDTKCLKQNINCINDDMELNYNWTMVSQFLVDIVHYTEKNNFLLAVDSVIIQRNIIRTVIPYISNHRIYSTVSPFNLKDHPNAGSKGSNQTKIKTLIEDCFENVCSGGRHVVITFFTQDDNNFAFEQVMERCHMMTSKLVWILIGDISLRSLNRLKSSNASIITASSKYFKRNSSSSSILIKTAAEHDHSHELGMWHQHHGLKMKKAIEYCCASMEGDTITVSVVNHGHLTILSENNTKLIGGMCHKILIELAKCLKFKYTLITQPISNYGNNRTGNWTGMIGHLIRRQADIAVGIFSWQSVRLPVVDYLPVFGTGNVLLVYKKHKNEFKWYGYMSTLHWTVWAVSHVCMLSLCFALAVVSYSLSSRSEADSVYLQSSFYIAFLAGLFAQQGSDNRPSSLSGNILMLTCLIYTNVMFLFFSTNLISEILKPVDEVDFTNLEELLLSKTYHPLTTLKSYNFYRNDYGHIPESTWNHFDVSHNVVDSFEEAFKRMSTERVVFFQEIYHLSNTLQNYSSVSVMHDTFQSPYSFVMRKDHKYYHILKRQIMRMKEKGVMNPILRRYQTKIFETMNELNAHPDSGQDIRLSAVKLPFVVLASCLLVAFIILICERCAKKKTFTQTN